MMKSCMRTLMALLLALSLVATGMALAEAELEIGEVAQDAAIEAVEGPEALPELALDDGALAIEDVEPDAAEAEANAPEEVKINKANFPAADFRNYVLANIDENGDKKLSRSEADGVREIVLRSFEQWENGENEVNCANLKGIEYFQNLERIEAIGCGLTELDVSKNRNLLILWCGSDDIKALDVSRNTKLEQLMCFRLPLTKLDVSKNRKVERLFANGNDIPSIDIANCPGLRAALKLKRKTAKKVVEWGVNGEEGWDAHMTIDRRTKLTAGSKVLYAGK